MAETTRVPDGATGCLVLASGAVIFGRGFGATGTAVGEVCFNTAMTGYQEVMTDPSYAGQIVTFTFPHIGNVGANAEDVEAINPHALGLIVREDVTAPSSFRSAGRFDDWLKGHGRIGLAGVDTRALTRAIRIEGAPNGVIAHDPEGRFDIAALIEQARAWPGLEGMDLAKDVSTLQTYGWDEGLWTLGEGYAPGARASTSLSTNGERDASPATAVRPEPVEGRAPGRNARPKTPRCRDRLRPQAQHPAQPRRRRRARDRRPRDRDLRRGDAPPSPTACSSPTAPATPPRPASTPCR